MNRYNRLEVSSSDSWPGYKYVLLLAGICMVAGGVLLTNYLAAGQRDEYYCAEISEELREERDQNSQIKGDLDQAKAHLASCNEQVNEAKRRPEPQASVIGPESPVVESPVVASPVVKRCGPGVNNTPDTKFDITGKLSDDIKNAVLRVGIKAPPSGRSWAPKVEELVGKLRGLGNHCGDTPMEPARFRDCVGELSGKIKALCADAPENCRNIYQWLYLPLDVGKGENPTFLCWREGAADGGIDPPTPQKERKNDSKPPKKPDRRTRTNSGPKDDDDDHGADD